MIDPENEKLPPSGPIIFLSMHIEGMCIGVDHKKFGKKIPTPWCVSGVFVLVGSVSSYISGMYLSM